MKPAIENGDPEIERLPDSLKGARLSHVSNVFPDLGAGTDGNELARIVKVDTDIVLFFDEVGRLRRGGGTANLGNPNGGLSSLW